jgi:hypothetical protein
MPPLPVSCTHSACCWELESGLGYLPLVAAVHPPRHHAAPGAGCLAGAGPGQHVH